MKPADVLNGILENCQPRRLLACGERAQELSWQWHETHPETLVTDIVSDEPARDPSLKQPYDLALITDTVEKLSPAEASLLLGQLRNLGSQQIAVLTVDEQGLSFNDFIGLGFVRHARIESAPPKTLFTYNIATYNRKRDWNNAKNWANPEMWDKARW
ncbi:MAG: hypothetical protein KGY54_12345 [Oleiphilaceae bacterium]|nr:hypothetical protein [Oleiphilaceae bacterium]